MAEGDKGKEVWKFLPNIELMSAKDATKGVADRRYKNDYHSEYSGDYHCAGWP